MSITDPIRFNAADPPRLLVLVDVEEEFDWQKEFDRAATRVSHARELADGLEVFAERGVVPVGVMTYPVAANPEAAAVLRELAAARRIEVGAHLHPWVTPPHEEQVTRRNSFPGNLPAELEERKLVCLSDLIEERLGTRPRVYQAGRYGLGPRTPALLERQGYQASISVNPPFDYSDEGGPDYSAAANDPYWFGTSRPLLEIPVTGAFVGAAGRRARALYRFATRPLPLLLRAPAILARLGVVERIRLSPEGHTLADLVRLTRRLHREGIRVFTLSFHSPTLKPGCTSYVRSEADRRAFLARCAAYVDYFLGDLGGEAATALTLHRRLLASHAPVAPLRAAP